MKNQESDIVPNLEIKIYHPTIAEFADMGKLIRQIESDPENFKNGIAKVSFC